VALALLNAGCCIRLILDFVLKLCFLECIPECSCFMIAVQSVRLFANVEMILLLALFAYTGKQNSDDILERLFISRSSSYDVCNNKREVCSIQHSK
jgi:hypothetical protein